jgi:probable lipoprotein (TIGR04455 family)
VKRIAGGLMVAALAGCATVKSTMVRKDYEQVDAKQTVRLIVVVAPFPAGSEAVGKLWGAVARRYANDHRDFIVKSAIAAQAEPANLCAEGVEGLLRLTPTAAIKGSGVEASVVAALTRCRDGELVWRAEAGGSWQSVDANVKEVGDHYATELGEEVRPYVAPAYHLLKETLDTLPTPVLDDKGKDEKIDLSD